MSALMRHKWMRFTEVNRVCEVCGMTVDRLPDRSYCWVLRTGRAVATDGRKASTGVSPTLSILPGCVAGQQRTADGASIPSSYGMFIQFSGSNKVWRMTAAGRIVEDHWYAAVVPNARWAQSRAEELHEQLARTDPGVQVWIAPVADRRDTREPT